MKPSHWSRRRLLGALSGGSLGLWAGPWARPSRAAPAGERKFLFVMCRGGWDTTYALSPVFEHSGIDTPPQSTQALAGGLAYADAASRPSVRAFYEQWHQEMCVVHGIEVPSVAHERSRQLVLTGRADGAADDWPSQLAAASAQARVLPHLVVSGPAFTQHLASQVVRIGDDGQLPRLLDGSALASSDMPAMALPSDASARVDAWLAQRGEAVGTGGQAGVWADGFAQVMAQKTALREQAQGLQLAGTDNGCERDLAVDFGTVFDAMELGLSRCAMVEYNGWCSEGWDTHSGIELQDRNTEDLFAYLAAMKADLATRVAPSGTALADELTVLVFSEMGRHPRINAFGGKDHWTTTSVLMMGSGVRGGQVLGGYDGSFLGLPIDLGSGEASAQGTRLDCTHLGATLLALGGVEAEGDPIRAVLSEG